MPVKTQPALNLGPLLARQQNAIEKCRFAGVPKVALVSLEGRWWPVFRWLPTHMYLLRNNLVKLILMAQIKVIYLI